MKSLSLEIFVISDFLVEIILMEKKICMIELVRKKLNLERFAISDFPVINPTCLLCLQAYVPTCQRVLHA